MTKVLVTALLFVGASAQSSPQPLATLPPVAAGTEPGDAPPPAPSIAAGPAVEPTAGSAMPEHVAPAGPAVAVRVLTTVQVAEPPPLIPVTPDWAQCPQWWQLARDVGWPEDQMATVDYVMHRESRCNAAAYNSTPCGGNNHAKGLMQLCGWACPPGGCYDPASNLARALELWQRSGWCPWQLRGDRVTPPC